jgi:uncharacterized protein (TIGR03067 family)
MTPTALTLTVIPSAPALKDAPTKEPPVVGRWVATQVLIGGTDNNQHEGLEYEFTADGTWIIYRDGKALDGARSYMIDLKAKPAAMDLTENSGGPYPGIFKIEGDGMTVLFAIGTKGRPTGFDVPTDGLMKVLFKRAKASD